MLDPKSTVSIDPHTAVNGIPFGASPAQVATMLGAPDNALHNYTGELEVLYGDAFYRFFEDRMVECTFPDTHRFVIGGIAVLSVFEWLEAQSDTLDKARFRISPCVGIAYDYRAPAQGSVTVFEAGRWDLLLEQ